MGMKCILEDGKYTPTYVTRVVSEEGDREEEIRSWVFLIKDPIGNPLIWPIFKGWFEGKDFMGNTYISLESKGGMLVDYGKTREEAKDKMYERAKKGAMEAAKNIGGCFEDRTYRAKKEKLEEKAISQ